MKQLIKKTIFTLLILFSVIQNSKAQTLCEDPCPPGPLLWMTIPLCDFTYTPYINGAPQMDETVVYVFVEIAYRIRTCGNDVTFIIEDYVYVDDRDYVGSLDPLFASLIAANIDCVWPNPGTPNSIRDAIADAISKFLNNVGNPTVGDYDVFFKGSCNSLVFLRFPSGAFITSTPDDLGRIDTSYFNSSSTIAQPIPCSDACCKITYHWQMVTTNNGETISKWVPKSGTNNNDICEPGMPDYDLYANKMTAQVWDPISGTYITVSGTMINQEPCAPICNSILGTLPPGFTASIKSDVSAKYSHIELIASPVPFNNFIKIDCNIEVKGVVVYDMSGRKVMEENSLENGELNTSELKNGVYFLQVHFPSNIVKTIKVIK
jgi:hypothetical protein